MIERPHIPSGSRTKSKLFAGIVVPHLGTSSRVGRLTRTYPCRPISCAPIVAKSCSGPVKVQTSHAAQGNRFGRIFILPKRSPEATDP